MFSLKIKHKYVVLGDGCDNSVGRIFLQCTHMSNLHIVYLKYLTILFVNYTSVKLAKKNNPFNKDMNCDRVVRSSISRPDSNIIHAVSMLLLCFGGTAVRQG